MTNEPQGTSVGRLGKIQSCFICTLATNLQERRIGEWEQGTGNLVKRGIFLNEESLKAGIFKTGNLLI